MDIRIEIAKLILVLFTLGPVVAENWALLRGEPDKYTPSRALKWLPENGTEITEDAVVGFAEHIPVAASEDYESPKTDQPLDTEEVIFYICRAYDPNLDRWVLGTVSKSIEVCQIRQWDSTVRDATHYEVLHNEERAVRLKWEVIQFDDITQQEKIPPNVVSVEQYYFIARIPFNSLVNGNKTVAIGGSYLICNLYHDMSSLWTLDVDKNLYHVSGTVQVLVEVEPELYEVTIDEMAKETASYKSNRAVLKLGEVTLRNTQQSSMKVESVIPFHWPPASNLSSNVSMLQGINTIISLDHSNISGKFRWSKKAVVWPRGKEEIHYRSYNVSAFLPAETGVRITLQAIQLDVLDILVGSLSTVYNDKYIDPEIPRPIRVAWWQKELIDLETVYGSMFHLSNNSTITTMTNSSTVETNSTPANTTSTNKSVTRDKGSSFMTSTTTTTFPALSRSTRPSATPTITFPALSTNTRPPATPTITFPALSTDTRPPVTQPNTTLPPTTTTPWPTSSTTTTIPAPTTTPTPPTTTTITPSPAPITTTTPKSIVNFEMTLFFKLKMKIPVK